MAKRLRGLPSTWGRVNSNVICFMLEIDLVLEFCGHDVGVIVFMSEFCDYDCCHVKLVVMMWESLCRSDCFYVRIVMMIVFMSES